MNVCFLLYFLCVCSLPGNVFLLDTAERSWQKSTFQFIEFKPFIFRVEDIKLTILNSHVYLKVVRMNLVHLERHCFGKSASTLKHNVSSVTQTIQSPATVALLIRCRWPTITCSCTSMPTHIHTHTCYISWICMICKCNHVYW